MPLDRFQFQRADQPRVVVEHARFVGLCKAVGAPTILASDPDWPGQAAIPGFRGGPSKLAVFILEARAELGDYDAAMLARVVRGREQFDGSIYYYFPGLELF